MKRRLNIHIWLYNLRIIQLFYPYDIWDDIFMKDWSWKIYRKIRSIIYVINTNIFRLKILNTSIQFSISRHTFYYLSIILICLFKEKKRGFRNTYTQNIVIGDISLARVSRHVREGSSGNPWVSHRRKQSRGRLSSALPRARSRISIDPTLASRVRGRIGWRPPAGVGFAFMEKCNDRAMTAVNMLPLAIWRPRIPPVWLRAAFALASKRLKRGMFSGVVVRLYRILLSSCNEID